MQTAWSNWSKITVSVLVIILILSVVIVFKVLRYEYLILAGLGDVQAVVRVDKYTQKVHYWELQSGQWVMLFQP